MIKVLCYGSGNVKAITNIYKRINVPCEVATTSDELRSADKIIVPGVGAFDQTMMLLEASGMLDTLNSMVLDDEVPVLGVCVGMQAMAHESEEGERKGLGWIDGAIKEIDARHLTHKPKLPHMGWNSVTPRQQLPILDGIDEQTGFYFLHSYYFACANEENVLTTSYYGTEFTSAVASGNIYGFQFHPEKSHLNGITIFKNFAEL
ncbi:MAG: imidazole glycerol phosphate synthase subunit HisH [Planctomycetaceae bacterium]|nr:imidazole glycerol phosphate synthase subunit HisH [Planctomycetaceae bacterium]